MSYPNHTSFRFNDDFEKNEERPPIHFETIGDRLWYIAGSTAVGLVFWLWLTYR